MSANRRTPPPLPPKPVSLSASKQDPRTSTNETTSSRPDQLRVDTTASSRRPQFRSTASSFSSVLTASTSSFAAKAKSGVKSGLNNYAKPLAKAALANASVYMESAADYLNDSRDGDQRSRSTSLSDSSTSMENLHLFPQWAVCVPRTDKHGNSLKDEKGRVQYDLECHVSGYCSTLISEANASIFQRSALKVMRAVIALPPIVAEAALKVEDKLTTSPVSTPVLEKIADQIDKDMHVQQSTPQPTRTSTTSSVNTVSPGRSLANISAEKLLANITPEKLQALHATLEERLAPFRASVTERRVQVSIYLVDLDKDSQSRHQDDVKPDHHDEPLITSVFTTTAQGTFEKKMVIPWERLRSGPYADKLAAGLPISSTYHPNKGLYVHAVLLSDGGPSQLPSAATSVPPSSSPQFSGQTLADEPKPLDPGVTRVDNGANAFFSSAVKPLSKGSGGDPGGLRSLGKTDVTASVFSNIASPGGIRVISDVDDTIKYSNIPGGAREAVRNAITRDIEDVAIEGMAPLYQRLAAAGVAGFSYVSNSPFELFPVIQSFLCHHGFPAGYSLKLKYYGRGHLVASFLQESMDRKLPGVQAVMNSFPKAKFILVGDSGEQDLELYVKIAKARPEQVLAIVIRDVSSAFTKKVNSPSRKPTMSEVDFTALDEALAHVDDHDQAAKAGIGGKSREAAKKLIRATSGLDLRRLKLSATPEATTPSGSQNSPGRQGSVASMSSVITSELQGSPTSSSGEGSSQNRRNGQESPRTQNTIPTIGATGFSSNPAASLQEEVKEVEDEFQELRANQKDLLERAATWHARVVNQSRQLPAGVRLLLFKEPKDIEETLLQLVKDNKL